MPRTRAPYPVSELDSSSAIYRWLLRLLVPLGVHREWVQPNHFRNDALAEALGLAEWVEPVAKEFDPVAIRKELRRRYDACERSAGQAQVASYVASNVERLRHLVGLSETDCRILEFAIAIHSDALLDDTADRLGALSTLKLTQVLSVILGLAERDVRLALGRDGALARSGLVSVDRNNSHQLRSKLDLLSSGFADSISSSDADPVSLLRDIVLPAANSRLTLADYEHIAASLVVLRPYLTRAVATGRSGVNVFIHGHSGTGKSELAKVLAQELGCELFEVASEDSDGDPVTGEKRLRAFRAAQSFFAKRHALVLFDEVEDVFSGGAGPFMRPSIAQMRKAWVNRTLEENPVPALWLSNSIEGIDPAFMRRFDLVIELPVPPKKQRECIIAAACTDLIVPAVVSRMAESEALAPAVVTRAAAVIRSIQGDLGTGTATALERLINNTLTAQGHAPLRRLGSQSLSPLYDPAFIQADADLAQIASGLAPAKSGRLCLYGPPGTGKSAYARWLAEQLEVPLVVKRASDLMSMYVGGNEKNIAQAFSQAEQSGALLLIDEVDGFLQDRRGAQRSWEASLVNEMLTQMESFSGVFVATTNLMEGLDPAALRRFDLKVKFDFLSGMQGVELLRRSCAESALAAPTAADEARVSRLHALTPGDFAAVGRQHRFRPLASAAAWVVALEAECTLKTGPKHAIGFY